MDGTFHKIIGRETSGEGNRKEDCTLGEERDERNEENRTYQEAEEDELEEEEIRKAVLKKEMKLKKAPGIDGIFMEAWRYTRETVKEGSIKILQQIWKEGNISKDWKYASTQERRFGKD